MSNHYQLTLGHDHCNVLASALALYVKIGCGRWEAILGAAPVKRRKDPLRDEGHEDIPESSRQEAHEVLVGMRNECFIGIEPGGFPLAHPRVPDQTRVAFDLLQAVLQVLSGVGVFTRTSMDMPMVPPMEAGGQAAVLTFHKKAHANVLLGATDIYARAGLGQWGPAIDLYGLDGDAMVYGFREPFRKLGAAYIGMMDGGSFGAGGLHATPASRVAFEINHVLRNRLAWDRSPEGGNSVDFHDPMVLSGLGLPAITRVTEGSSSL